MDGRDPQDTVTLIVNGSIIGKGGDAWLSGGPALAVRRAAIVINNGIIGGGGGGGAGTAQYTTTGEDGKINGYVGPSGGGGGAGWYAGVGGAGGDYYFDYKQTAVSGATMITGPSGAGGTMFTGGAPGGGSLGMNGSAGIAGQAVIGKNFVNLGNGVTTGTIYGEQT